MKTIKTFLAAGMIAASCCSIAKAQFSYSNSLSGATLVYSNGFDGAAINITNTGPDYAVSLFGGTNNALWLDALGIGDTNSLLANGTQGTAQGDSWLLPFVPQTSPGLVYTLTASVTMSGQPGSWFGSGFAQFYRTNAAGFGRFADAGPNGYDWTIIYYVGTCNLFAGAKAANQAGGKSGFFTSGVGTHVITQILDTTSNKWTIACFLDGVPTAGTNYGYSSNPTIGALGLTQTFQTAGAQGDIHWNSLSLCASPIVIGQQPASAVANAGSAFTNSVLVAAATPSYQWYFNSSSNYAGATAMTNTADGRIRGTTASSLAFTNVQAGDVGYYYIVVTNTLGSMTSSIASLGVYSSPIITAQLPATYTNIFTLFAGANPQFSIAASGSQPIHYQWFTNGVACHNQTNSSFIWTNLPIGVISNYCVATNTAGAATSLVWTASVIANPTAPFPTNVLAFKPIGYWPLNEAEVGGGDDGVIALDYAGGNDGTYTNAALGYPGYSGTDPSDTSPIFGYVATPDSGAFGIQGISFGAPINVSSTFTVQAWANNAGAIINGAGIVSEGYEGSEQFALDIANNHYQFLVHDASGNAYGPTAGFGPDGNWHYLVGVCDEVNGAVSLYVDGELAASVPIASGSGLLSSTNAMSIGARSSTPAADNDLQFYGYVDQVAAFNYALTPLQVAQLAGSVGLTNAYSVYFLAPAPPTNVAYHANGTLTVPAMVSGQPPVGYYWSNTTTTVVMGSGATNGFGFFNVTLSIPGAPTNLSGDELELVVTNAFSSTNCFVSLISVPPPALLSYTNTVLYSNAFVNGATWTIDGTVPTEVNVLVGSTNTAWICTFTNTPVASNGTIYGDGSLGTNAGSSLLPFTPEAGYVYTMTASLTAPSGMGDWVGMGFAQSAIQTNNPGFARFTDSPINGYAWMYVQNANGVLEQGPRTSGSSESISTVPLPSANPITMELILNTETNEAWTVSAFVNGTQIGTNFVFTIPPPIAYVGFVQNQFTSSSDSGIQWNDWELTEEGTNVPPYLLAPLPPTTVTVFAGGTLTIPATAFGWAPLGYSWSNTNTATVLASGITNTSPPIYDAPLPSNLTVPNVPAGWNGDKLALTLTNAFGTNTTLVSVTVIAPPTLQIAVTNGQATVSWPSADIGLWTLQVQTNSLTGSWANVPNSTTTNLMTFPVNPAKGGVFYRLYYP